MPTTKERINTLPRDHSQLRNTPSFAPNFVALIASIPICHTVLCRYSSRKPCTYSHALHLLAHQAEILWYNNNPEVPPSFSHCYLAINEITGLSNNVLGEAGDSLTDIDTVHTRHAHAMREAWFTKNTPSTPTLHMINASYPEPSHHTAFTQRHLPYN